MPIDSTGFSKEFTQTACNVQSEQMDDRGNPSQNSPGQQISNMKHLQNLQNLAGKPAQGELTRSPCTPEIVADESNKTQEIINVNGQIVQALNQNLRSLTADEYVELKNLQNWLKNGISVLRHRPNSESIRVTLGCTTSFDFLTVCPQNKKTNFSMSDNGSKQASPPLCTKTVIRGGTDPDLKFPGLTGSVVLRNAGATLEHSLSIIWPNHALHLEFASRDECRKFNKAIRLWKSKLTSGDKQG